jgi:streptogramin lyase
VREYAGTTERSGPYGIVIAPDGKIWYNEAFTNQMIAFDPGTEKFEATEIPTRTAVVRHIALDPARGRIWLALSGTHRLGRIDVPSAASAGR